MTQNIVLLPHLRALNSQPTRRAIIHCLNEICELPPHRVQARVFDFIFRLGTHGTRHRRISSS